MSRTLQVIHHSRQLVFAVVALTMTTAIWLLMADLIIRYPLGALMLRHLSIDYGFWPMFAHGIRGVMGFYPETLLAHWSMTLIGLGVFLLTQAFFINPHPFWSRTLVYRTDLPMGSIVAASLPAAMLSLGAIAMVLEAGGLWRYLPGSFAYWGGWLIYPQAGMSLTLLLVLWGLWIVVLSFWANRHDRFLQLASVLYGLFVAGGIELLVAGLLQARIGFYNDYWLNGAYSACMISVAVMLWTLGPGVTLVYHAQLYRRARLELLEAGDRVGAGDFAY